MWIFRMRATLWKKGEANVPLVLMFFPTIFPDVNLRPCMEWYHSYNKTSNENAIKVWTPRSDVRVWMQARSLAVLEGWDGRFVVFRWARKKHYHVLCNDVKMQKMEIRNPTETKQDYPENCLIKAWSLTDDRWYRTHQNTLAYWSCVPHLVPARTLKFSHRTEKLKASQSVTLPFQTNRLSNVETWNF